MAAFKAEINRVIDNRGFTGHEMLDQLDLVHMNGRIYDPLTARFMSADPILQDPMNAQSYNRYSYVLNNPTNLTDPTGFKCDASTGSRIGTCDAESKAWGQAFNNLSAQDQAKVIAAIGIKMVNTVLTVGGHDKVDAKNLGAAKAADLFKKVDGEISNLMKAMRTVEPGDKAGHADRFVALAGMRSNYLESAEALGQKAEGGAGSVLGGINLHMGISAASSGVTKPGLLIIGAAGTTMMMGGDGQQGGGSSHMASSAKQASDLSKHLGYIEKYGKGGVKELQNGRIRYYGEIQSASKPGEMAGRRYVHEYDSVTGRSRGWHETVDHAGNVRQVRPELNNGSKTHHQFDSSGKYTGSW